MPPNQPGSSKQASVFNLYSDPDELTAKISEKDQDISRL